MRQIAAIAFLTLFACAPVQAQSAPAPGAPARAAPRALTAASLRVMVNAGPATATPEELAQFRAGFLEGMRGTRRYAIIDANDAAAVAPTGRVLAVRVTVTGVRRVSRGARWWVGGMAGKASVKARVEILDGDALLEALEVEGRSTGGSVDAGTTEDALAGAVLGAVAFVAGHIEPEVVPVPDGSPFETVADGALRADIEANLKLAQSVLVTSCPEAVPVAAKPVRREGDAVSELWTLKGCGKLYDWPVTLTPSAKGGTDIAIDMHPPTGREPR